MQQRNLATCPPLCRGREGPLPSSSLPLALDVGGSDPAGEVGGDDGGEENRSGEWPWSSSTDGVTGLLALVLEICGVIVQVYLFFRKEPWTCV